ncbi:acyl-CoA dehydrogenase family protein [Archangium violaceum]|uniref:acyl-CoA dehydrogenase family protein n=1 Tax=Archangium violaceum TaxID=83451 RepID=UPI00194F3995|nr:acyl-CoA dehydrogenase family protein [Archangium violaceum]QRN93660.1 acyl-CoA dehydrogenase family protein [Archangium violaceum]
MDFSLTDTQRMLRDTAVRLIRERYGFESRAKILASAEGFSRELWATFAEMGLLGVELPEQHGGIGGTFQDLAIVLEAFGRGMVVEPFLPTVVLGAGLIRAAGSEAQKSSVLPRVAEGALFLAFAHGEPRSRYSLTHVATTARRDAEGYTLNGAKAVVLGGDCADLLLVSARTAGKADDRDGLSLFLVERGAPGLRIRGYPNVDGTRAAEVALEGVRVPHSALLGGEGGAFPFIQQAIDRGIAALCAEAVGNMQALNELTLDYLKTRIQFGVPIGSFQVLQHHMVDMFIAHEQARSMAILAADRADSADAQARTKAISAAKVQIGRSGRFIGQQAIQLHGGIGTTLEYSAGHYFKRLTTIDRTFGDADFHLTRFATVDAA